MLTLEELDPNCGLGRLTALIPDCGVAATPVLSAE